jgi:putative MATE family efflux protein
MKRDLTKGSIFGDLISVAAPIIFTSFIQTAYNLTDMAWLGRDGSDSVTAAGTAGFYLWLSFAIILLVKIGTQIKISHSVGEGDDDKIISYFRSGLQLIIFMSIAYGLLIGGFGNQSIGFFGLESDEIFRNSVTYLQIVMIANVFMSVNQVISGSFNGLGNSKIPFYIGSIGLVFNMVLDPLFIFGFGLGVKGAAIATLIASVLVTIIYVIYISTKTPLFKEFKLVEFDTVKMKEIISLSYPSALQSGVFTIISMVIGRIIIEFGDVAMGVQKVGAQIEALSWMTASGIQTALSAFVGQNFGAKKYHRLSRGISIAMVTMALYGVGITLLFIIFAEPIFRIFIPNEPEVYKLGADYIRIISASQLPMIIELTISGGYFGLGETKQPALIGIVGNLLRIPLALIIPTFIGLNGIWWALNISSIFKGVVALLVFIYIIKKKPYLHFKDFLHLRKTVEEA